MRNTVMNCRRIGLARLAVIAAFVLTAFASAPALAASEFVIAVLGDSYAAGEGAPDVHGSHSLAGNVDSSPECLALCRSLECISRGGGCFPEKWWSPNWFPNRRAVFPQGDDPGWQADARRCHRSTHGPAAHAAMILASRFPDVKVSVLDFACSGSKIISGLLAGWSGMEPPPFAPNLPSQFQALNDYATRTSRAGKIDALVMNIGGNDAHFANIVFDCILVPLADCRNGGANSIVSKITAQTVDGLSSYNSEFAKLSTRYDMVDRAIRNTSLPTGIVGLSSGRPKEVYLTDLPNPSHDFPSGQPATNNPLAFCDGTQTRDYPYINASRGESEAIETLLGKINGAMARAAQRFGWTSVKLFGLSRDHGVCADSQSYFRTNTAALKIQGNQGMGAIFSIPVGFPALSPGIAHQNETGYAARAQVIANFLEAQLRLRLIPQALTAGARETSAFTVKWTTHATSEKVPATRWDLRITRNGQTTLRRSDQVTGEVQDERLSDGRHAFTWRVPLAGGVVASLRGCRTTPTAGYCGPFSNEVTVIPPLGPIAAAP